MLPSWSSYPSLAMLFLPMQFRPQVDLESAFAVCCPLEVLTLRVCFLCMCLWHILAGVLTVCFMRGA